jgi:hypothetical protein
MVQTGASVDDHEETCVSLKDRRSDNRTGHSLELHLKVAKRLFPMLCKV